MRSETVHRPANGPELTGADPHAVKYSAQRCQPAGPRPVQRGVGRRLRAVMPVAWTAALMCDRGDEHLVPTNAVKKCEWIAGESVPMLASRSDWPSLGRFTNGGNRVLELKQKPLCGHVATLPVPPFVFEQLLLGFGVKSNRFHPRR
jgi:hypothetical protein